MEPVRWGLVSTARINDAFLGGVAESEIARVVAVASRDAERGAAYARGRGIPTAHPGYEALLADPGVEAVYISLPNGLHLEWTERALRAGKHVLCEKPLGRDPDAVAAVFDVAEREGRVLSEGFMYRHHPQTLRLAELVSQGAVGRLRLIRSHFSFPLHDPADVRLAAALDGGALMDLGCYCLSAARLLAGEPVSVSGQQVLGGDTASGGGGGVDLAFAGTLCFPDDVLAHFDAAFTAVDRSELEVVGDGGTLRVSDPWHIRAPAIELTNGDGTRTVAIEPANSYRLQAEDVSRAVRGDRPARLGRGDAIGQARAIAALYAAAADVPTLPA